MSSNALAMRLDYGATLCELPTVAAQVSEIIARPCFSESLTRVSARRLDRWVGHRKSTGESINAALLDPRNEAISFDNGRVGERTASAEVQSGPMVRPKAVGLSTRYMAYVAMSHLSADLDARIAGFCDLAGALEAAAGYIAVEPDYSHAHEVAIGCRRPRERAGLSVQRFRERRGRDWKSELIHTKVSGIEWMTVLGPGHLAALANSGLELQRIRESGVFHRVIEVMPRPLVLLQLTADPADDLTDGFEEQLVAARTVLAPIMMDVADVSLD